MGSNETDIKVGVNGPASLEKVNLKENLDNLDSMKSSPHRKLGVAKPPPLNHLTQEGGASNPEAPPPPPVNQGETALITPPDGGYGWVIVFAAFMNHIIVDGIAFTFGVFLKDFTDYFEAGSARTALVGSLMSGCYLLTAPFAGILITHFGCRTVAMCGGVLAAMGFSLCTLSPDINVLMVTYGIMGGVGLGILYLPNMIAVSYYFEKKRALATGIAVCGAGVGCFVFAPLGMVT